jgi:MYND finger
MSEDQDNADIILWQPNWFQAMKDTRWYSGPPPKHIHPVFQSYHPYACHSCKRGPLTNTKLFVCTQCHIIKYCSKKCQQSDWNFHKDWCQRFRRLCQNEKLDTFLLAEYHSFKAWHKHMNDMTIFLMQEMKVEPHSIELDIVLSQPRCRKCFQAGLQMVDGKKMCHNVIKLTTCPKCMGVALCNHCLEQGLSSVEDIKTMTLEQSISIFHSNTNNNPEDECLNHLLSVCCLAMVVENGAPLKIVSRTDCKEYWRPSSWQEYFAKKRDDFYIPGPPAGMIHLAPVVAFLSDAHSLTLTMQHILGLPELEGTVMPKTMKKLVIHLCGASDLELSMVGMFAEITRLNPGLKEIQIHLVGPNLNPDNNGRLRFLDGESIRSTCKFTMRQHRGLYHEVVIADSNGVMPVPGLGDIPTLVFCQHSGLHTAAYAVDWIPTVLALKEMDVPVVWTGFNHNEVVDDGKVLDELGVNLIVKPTPNPFRSLYPFTDPYREQGDFIYANASFVVMKGSTVNAANATLHNRKAAEAANAT